MVRYGNNSESNTWTFGFDFFVNFVDIVVVSLAHTLKSIFLLWIFQPFIWREIFENRRRQYRENCSQAYPQFEFDLLPHAHDANSIIVLEVAARLGF